MTNLQRREYSDKLFHSNKYDWVGDVYTEIYWKLRRNNNYPYKIIERVELLDDGRYGLYFFDNHNVKIESDMMFANLDSLITEGRVKVDDREVALNV